MSIFSKTVLHIKGGIVKNFINGLLQDIGEGKFGAPPKALYWWAHSHALWIGLVLGVAHFTMQYLMAAGTCAKCANADYWLVTVAETLVAAGLATGLHAAEPPAKG